MLEILIGYVIGLFFTYTIIIFAIQLDFIEKPRPDGILPTILSALLCSILWPFLLIYLISQLVDVATKKNIIYFLG